jgi:hypothetical protein
VQGTPSQHPAALKHASPYGAQISPMGGGTTHCPSRHVPAQVRPQAPQFWLSLCTLVQTV